MAVVERITITDQLSPAIAKAIVGIADLGAPMAEISNDLLDTTETRFRAQVSPDGVPWIPSQRVVEEGGDTLYLSGALYNALDRDSGPDFAEVGVLATGGPAIYAEIHQAGGTIRAKSGRALNTPRGPFAAVVIPPRPYLGITKDDQTNAVGVLEEHVNRLFDSDETEVQR